MEQIKPCPFCGGRACVSKIYFIKEYEVICMDCEISFHPVCAVSEKSVIEAWNRRVSE